MLRRADEYTFFLKTCYIDVCLVSLEPERGKLMDLTCQFYLAHVHLYRLDVGVLILGHTLPSTGEKLANTYLVDCF